MEADFQDIRFTDEAETSEILAWNLSQEDSVAVEVLVNVSLTADANTTIYMYYDNDGASATWDFNAQLYDDFEDDALNSDKFYFSRPTCDGGSAWAESSGSASSTCVCSSKSWMTGISMMNGTQYDYSEAYITWDTTTLTGAGDYGNSIGWAKPDSNVWNDNQYTWSASNPKYTTSSTTTKNNTWTDSAGDIDVKFNGAGGGTLTDVTDDAYSPVQSVTWGGGNTASITIFNVWAYDYAETFPEAYFGAETLQTTVESFLKLPADASSKLPMMTTFEVNSTASGTTLNNVTLHVWDGDTLLYTNTSIITGVANSTQFIQNLTDNKTYTWNGLVGGGESKEDWATANFTIGINKIEETANTFESEVTEGESTLFTFNFTSGEAWSPNTAILNYAGTNYTGSLNFVVDKNYTATHSLTAPNIDAGINNTFYWIVGWSDSTTMMHSSENNQSVLAIGFDDCSSEPVLLMNLTLKDEEDLFIIDNSTNITLIEVDIELYTSGTTNEIANYSSSFSQINPAQVCISDGVLNATDFDMDATIRYDGDTNTTNAYVSEFYHIQKSIINNNTIPEVIDLFSLRADDSQEFLITFKDENFVPVQDALVNIQRKYIPEGIFRTVEIPKSDTDGQSLGHFVLSEVIYNLIVTKDGIVLGTFPNIVPFCENQATGDCKININVYSGGVDLTNYSTKDNILYTFTTNMTTRTLTSVFHTIDGSTTTMLLNATKFDAYGNVSACSTSLTSASGTLNCVVPASMNNLTVIGELFKDGKLIAQKVFTIKYKAGDVFGASRIFIILIALLTLPLIAIASAELTILFTILAVVILGFLNVIEGGSMFGVGSTILWLVIAGGTIIWKIRRNQHGV